MFLENVCVNSRETRIMEDWKKEVRGPLLGRRRTFHMELVALPQSIAEGGATALGEIIISKLPDANEVVAPLCSHICWKLPLAESRAAAGSLPNIPNSVLYNKSRNIYKPRWLSTEKRQKIKSRIPAVKDRVDSPSPVPHYLPIGFSFDIEDSMLRNIVLIAKVPIPRSKASLQASCKPILVHDHIVLFVELGVPDDAIDDICV